MKKLARFFWRVGLGFYDIVGLYLLAICLYVAAVSIGIHYGAEGLAHALGFEEAELVWLGASRATGLNPIAIRLVAALAIQLGVFWLIRHPLAFVSRWLGELYDAFYAFNRRFSRRAPRLHAVYDALGSLLLTAALIPFLVQPTLVGFRADLGSLYERAANLADGSATLEFASSAVGFYRKLYADPAESVGGVDPDALERALAEQEDEPDLEPDGRRIPSDPPTPAGPEPMMDRWDAMIVAAVRGDIDRASAVKAFMYVESAGRQFAVSHTGCSGLMQFCAGTARGKRFRPIFGRGQIYPCRCSSTRCRIARRVQRELESGAPGAVERNAPLFPCDLTDARFDADKSIRAGARYVTDLYREFGGNMNIMYIGYNSGPAVARRVWIAVGRDAGADRAAIALHLADSMRPWYGAGSERRARSLLRTHLPKLERARDRYRARMLEDAALARVVW